MAKNTAANPSTNSHAFTAIPKAEIPRSAFRRNYNLKTTFDAGWLIPIFVDEALPGDTITIRPTVLARIATPIWPVMDNMYLDTFFFAIPYRLLWDNFKRFMGEQDNPADSTSYVVPQLVSGTGGFALGGLMDYMGVPPTATASTTSVSAFPSRAYNLVWNQHFRDENLQNSVVVDKGDGPDAIANYTLLKRGKRKDYFTSALPWPQKGTAVNLPLGTTAPVNFTFTGTPEFTRAAAPLRWGKLEVRDSTSTPAIGLDGSGSGNWTTGDDLTWRSLGFTAQTDLATATAATINQIRTAFQIQRLYERDARGGTRYVELVQSHFGVTSPDQTQARSEFIGGGSLDINIVPVANTLRADQPNSGLELGSLAGYGTATGGVPTIHKSFTEHSVILGLAMVRADLHYQQGLDRMWSRSTKFDFYWPALAHLGEQAILSKEIYMDGTAADQDVFGYQERWAEYRYKPSQVTGKFRSKDPLALDAWHLSQNFSSRPLLNATFIVEDPPIDRVIAVPSEPHFIMDAHFDFIHVRPMPTYSVPGLIDHF